MVERKHVTNSFLGIVFLCPFIVTFVFVVYIYITSHNLSLCSPTTGQLIFRFVTTYVFLFYLDSVSSTQKRSSAFICSHSLTFLDRLGVNDICIYTFVLFSFFLFYINYLPIKKFFLPFLPFYGHCSHLHFFQNKDNLPVTIRK